MSIDTNDDETEFSVENHIVYFSGYLDAVGRACTTEDILFVSGCEKIPSGRHIGELLNLGVISEIELNSFVRTIENEIGHFFETKPNERLIFYLIEYFLWFDWYTNSCTVKKCELLFEQAPIRYLAYSLQVNEDQNVFIYFAQYLKSTPTEASEQGLD